MVSKISDPFICFTVCCVVALKKKKGNYWIIWISAKAPYSDDLPCLWIIWIIRVKTKPWGSEELPHEFRDSIVEISRKYRVREYGRFLRAATSINLKWQKVCNYQDHFQSRLTKLQSKSNLTKKRLSERRDQKTNSLSGWVPGDLKEFQQVNHHCSIPAIWAWWQNVQTGASLQLNSIDSILRTLRLRETRFSGLIKKRLNILAII